MSAGAWGVQMCVTAQPAIGHEPMGTLTASLQQYPRADDRGPHLLGLYFSHPTLMQETAPGRYAGFWKTRPVSSPPHSRESRPNM